MAKRVYLPKSMPRRVAKYVLKKTGLLPLAKRVLGRPQSKTKKAAKPKTPSYANVREVLSYMNAMLVRAPLPVTPVVVYFEGNMTRWYQVEMWFDILQNLSSEVPISFVIRNQSVFRKIVNETEFPVYLCTTIDDVMNIYDNNDIKCILYVNHAAKNFQSLINKNAFHIHINHGESDKLSTITNQATAYDFVYVVGDAAVNRYAANLLRRDMSRFVKIGRPQLEHVTPIDQELITFPQIGDDEKKVVLYAPTWEGTHHSMNYSSIPEFGVELIKELLADPKFQVIYKPHPNTGSREEATRNAHKEIISLVTEHEDGLYVEKGDINAIYPNIDIPIFDNSTVTIDYLAQDKPFLITDLFHRAIGLSEKPPIISAAKVIAEGDIKTISKILENQMDSDPLAEQREKTKTFYLGEFDYTKQESTRAFIEQIKLAIAERDSLVAKRDQTYRTAQ